ncbi:MAG: LysM peptidoglycan-binding domain-containing protein [Sphingobacteriales bacterium]|nr:LysM peptidoglycan-binding domain-containing protein [Sphingobacteriales bacterium]
MIKRFSIAFILILTIQFVLAQKTELMVKSGDNGLYLVHKVAPRESFFAIGRLYNVSAKYLASYNKLDMNKGLQIDQKIRIPLTDTNFSQKGNSGTPVYYKVDDEKELAKISAVNKNVSVESLKAWNDLAGDKAKKDAKLIIGFLHSKAMPSVTISSKPKQEDSVVKLEEKTVVPVANPEEKKPKAIEEIKKTEPVVVNEETKPIQDGDGFFKTSFDQQVRVNPVSKNETVTAGIFKTTSGWQDAKYYMLMDNVQPGTIVKVINPANNMAVFVKVLGEMAGIRQNEGYNIRISNAAAAALQIQEQDKFIVKVSY